jgi:hypothetical protein
MAAIGRGKTDGQKKSPLRERAESIFLEEDRGDRKHDAASQQNSPMMFRDGSHPDGACLPAGAAGRQGTTPSARPGMMLAYRYIM